MKSLIKTTSRRLVLNSGYGGVCHDCNSPVFFDGEFVLVEIKDYGDSWSGVPIDIFYCPYCGNQIYSMRIYKSLEVSGEISGIKKGTE